MASAIGIRVELPAYGYSFTVTTDLSSATVLSLKYLISNTCPGAPQVEGQRIIWRGRVLGNEERVAELWPMAADTPIVVHLSVHPSAWRDSPPVLEARKGKEKDWEPEPTRTIHAALVSPSYILSKHRQALCQLTHEPFVQSSTDRESAVKFVNSHGFIWPAALDIEFGEAEEDGVRYQSEIIDGRPYLRIVNPNARPTPAQLQAFEVLSYTLELLKLPGKPNQQNRVASSPSRPPVPAHLSTLLQQMGLPPLNNAQEMPAADNAWRVYQAGGNVLAAQPPAANAQVVQVNLRPLIIPILMLSLRTLLLLYFVAPARKPFLALMILAWVGWEIWGWVVGRGEQGAVDANVDAAPPLAQQGQNEALPQQQQPQPQPQADNVPPNAAPAPPNAAPSIFDTLAQFDIPQGELALNSFSSTQGRPHENYPEPSVLRKAISFVVLFCITAHPAVWNRRRKLLRMREGRVRVEMGALSAGDETAVTIDAVDAQDNDNTSPEREQARQYLVSKYLSRPIWVRRYMIRVMRVGRGEGDGGWVDAED